jgi:carbon monoxide dehydrogenase subunit G
VKVELEKTFPLPSAPEAAWRLLQDVEAVASCMPGAAITERMDDAHYKGTVRVKVGPVTLAFRGDIEVRGVDAATRTLRLYASGSDTTGSSAGSMDLTARIDPVDGGLSSLNGQSVVSLSGKAAAFGGRMVNSVADQILAQFAGNFATRLAALPPQLPSAESVATNAPSPAPSPVPSTSPSPAPELNALALCWGICRDWLRALFGRKRG